jgi:hypothetical protein
VANIPSQATSLELTDQLGRLIISQYVSGTSAFSIDIEQKGLVFVSLFNQDGLELETIKYIMP